MATAALFQNHEPAFEPEATQAMSIALDEVCRALALGNDAGAREAIAVRIIELARRGERDPIRLSRRVIDEASAGNDLG